MSSAVIEFNLLLASLVNNSSRKKNKLCVNDGNSKGQWVNEFLTAHDYIEWSC